MRGASVGAIVGAFWMAGNGACPGGLTTWASADFFGSLLLGSFLG